MDSAAFGAVGMCITGHLMELWETPVMHISTVLSFYFSAEPKLRPFHRPAAYQKRSGGTRSQLRYGAVRGIGGLPQQAVLRSKTGLSQ